LNEVPSSFHFSQHFFNETRFDELSKIHVCPSAFLSETVWDHKNETRKAAGKNSSPHLYFVSQYSLLRRIFRRSSFDVNHFSLSRRPTAEPCRHRHLSALISIPASLRQMISMITAWQLKPLNTI